MNERLVFRHSRRMPVGIWSVCVLAFWIYAGAEMLDRAHRVSAHRRDIEIVGAFWTVVSLLFLSGTLWIWFGDTIVELKGELLTIDARVFDRVIYRYIACPISELQSLRLEVYERNTRSGAIRKRRLIADYRGTRKVILDQLSDRQAEAVRDATIWRSAGGVTE
jgi:hypothetical protein